MSSQSIGVEQLAQSPVWPRSSADPAVNPTAAAAVLGARLRNLRESRNQKQANAARAVNFSPAKLSRIECAETLADEEDVLLLARYYRVADEEENELLRLVQQARKPLWWQRYTDAAPGWLERLIGLEGAAVEVRSYEAVVVPGLLQTEDYARRVVARHYLRTQQELIERTVALRMERQSRFFESPPRLAFFLINQLALQPTVPNPHVMAEQVRHLLDMAQRPGVKIRVLPMSRMLATPIGSLSHLKFNPGGPPQMVYLEGYETADYYPEASGGTGGRRAGADMERHVQLLLELERRALTRRKSLELLQQAVASYH